MDSRSRTAASTGGRQKLLSTVADRVPRGTGSACVRVAVDGVDGAGKTVFAAELAETLRGRGRDVVQVSADDFHQPREVRYRRGRQSPEGFWLDSYDYAALIANVLEPFGPDGSRRYRPGVHDVDTDECLDLPWRVAPPGAVLIVDGMFLHRDELAGVWDLSIYLQVPFEVTAGRMAQRDGSHPDPEHPSLARYVGGQRLYFESCSPWERADVVVDNSDVSRPVVVPR